MLPQNRARTELRAFSSSSVISSFIIVCGVQMELLVQLHQLQSHTCNRLVAYLKSQSTGMFDGEATMEQNKGRQSLGIKQRFSLYLTS